MCTDRRGRCAFLVALLLVITTGLTNTARGAGVYEDITALTGFLLSRHTTAAFSRFIVTANSSTDASLVVVGARFAPRPGVLVELEIPHITANIGGTDLRTGFGDVRMRARLRLRQRPGRLLCLLGDVGAGSGNTSVFPYASGSVEFGLGAAWSDTTDIVDVYVTAGWTAVGRQPSAVSAPDPSEYDDFGRLLAGVVFHFGDTIGLNVAASGLFFASDPVREAFLASLLYDYATRIRFFGSLQFEGGARADRVADASVTAGMTVLF